MRALILVFLIFFFAPTAHAACVQNPESGAYYDNVTYVSCTPQSGGASGSWDEPATTGGTQQGTGGNNQVQTGSGGTNTGTNITLINPLNTGECAPNGNCLMNFLNKILDFVIKIGTVVVILMLVYVGYLFVAARGEPGKLETARSALLWTVVGALILLGSKAIAIGIEQTVRAISAGQ